MATNSSSEAIPNRFDYAEAQDRIYLFWENAGFFNAEPDLTRPSYSVVIPPPNVTGALHLGHALNNTLQDVLIRMKRMQGLNTLWMPGTDHAGIATQAVVEKRLLEEENKTRHDLGREALVERIWQWKEDYEARILKQLKRMGCSCDWRRTRFTLDEVCARAVRYTFFDLFRKGLIYRGKRLVNWDTYLQTTVSDDEVFHDVVQGHFWHIQYPVIDPKPGEPTHVSVATTRPETMLGDTAVAVHPNPAQALGRVEADLQEKLATAPSKEKPLIQQQLEEVRQRRETMLASLELLRDMAGDGRAVLLPLLDRPIPLVQDEWAKPEMGSGCVKITPAHDPNDYEVGLRQKLPMINILNRDGTLNENAGPYQGQVVLTARDHVIEDLQERGLLEKVEDREIDLAHSDRSKTPIEPYLADQWFVKMAELAQSAMDAVTDERVKIFPERYTKGYLDWLNEKRDWPIGRQLWWGHRIPVWTLTPKEPDCAASVREALPKAFAANGIANFSDCVAEAADPPEGSLRFCTLNEEADGVFDQIADVANDARAEIADVAALLGKVEREDEVLDTWFSSALWPHSTMGWPEKTPELATYYPTSVLITSRDIITLWVARMVLTGLNNMGEIPFHEVFIHPKILDGDGVGMSKSKGNGVDPLDVIEKFGPDALRFGLAYITTDTQDVRMPVQFECPHCEHLLDQTVENRQLPQMDCLKCGKAFSTQWAALSEEDLALPRGPVVSERFEQARNFCNKLWNAARFALINLDGYEPGPVDESELTVEDRWLLSRLATVTQQVTQALDGYHYAEAARALYEFAWDEFCSFYVEMVKGRLQDEATRITAQRVLAHTLDSLMRLLHPITPYITEEIWQLLNGAAPERGLPESAATTSSVMVAAWPQADFSQQDPEIEAQFATFQAVLGAVREIRSRQTIPTKTPVEFFVRAHEETCSRLEPMQAYFKSMANAHAAGWGPDIEPPATRAAVNLSGIDVFVDLTGLIDVDAEIERNEQQEKKLLGLIQGKVKKLANDNFVQRAPADIVQREREGLVQLKEQLATVQATLQELRKGG